jgi:hypothetical protein
MSPELADSILKRRMVFIPEFLDKIGLPRGEAEPRRHLTSRSSVTSALGTKEHYAG